MYKLTHLEDWITDFYRRLNIKYPQDIKMSKICRDLRVFLILQDLPSYTMIYGNLKRIHIDSRNTKEEQREHFYHELCHVLLHVGRQDMMPQAFLELQEAQATTFTMYAALPYFMLKEYDLHDRDIIYILSEDFCVTEKLVVKRLIQIKNRILSYYVR
jgi:Zn-dependent peptidase ImmA (M78 family)